MNDYSVHKIEAGEFPSNSYVCLNERTGFSFLVDPGLDHNPIEEYLRSRSLHPRAVTCTHGHFDHIGSASYFQDKYSIPVFLHADDHKIAKAANFLLMALGMKRRLILPRFSLVAGKRVAQEIEDQIIYFNQVPGHTPGSCILEFGNLLFSGDSLYARGLGLSNLPGEDAELLRCSLKEYWSQISPDCHVLPGHGPSASFADIQKNNKSLSAFLADHPKVMEV